MPQSAASRKKQAKTFSLSEDVIEILETYRRKKKVESLTSAVEQIIREWRKSDLAAQVTAYYDSLSDDDMKKDKEWGKFSESQM
jgi:uncharacterized protein YeeX (DUF496 family)